MDGPVHSFPVNIKALFDHGSHAVLISERCAESLGLRRRKLPVPKTVQLAMGAGGKKTEYVLHDWVKLKLRDLSCFWTAKSVRAIVAPGLCAPVILGLPFLAHNNIVIDHSACTAVDKASGFDLLHPLPPPVPEPPKQRLKDFFQELKQNQALLVTELKMVCVERLCTQKHREEPVKQLDLMCAAKDRIANLAAQVELTKLGETVKTSYADVFAPIPHIDELPTDVFCRIQLKDAYKTISRTCTYSTPRKYKDAWATLIQQHLDAGHICPSNSAHASPAFLVPKTDTVVLPRWVNDYRALNANTVVDSHLLP
jgi:hypothetical protein